MSIQACRRALGAGPAGAGAAWGRTGRIPRARGGYYPETDRCGVTLHPYGVTLDALTGGLRLQADSTAAGGSSQILLDPPLADEKFEIKIIFI